LLDGKLAPGAKCTFDNAGNKRAKNGTNEYVAYGDEIAVYGHTGVKARALFVAPVARWDVCDFSML
jgi:hypothetical protein